MAGAPVGNQNAKNSRVVADAFRRAIKQRDLTAGDGETLREIVEAQLDQAKSGDVASFREVRDTLDGKPVQAITGEDGGPLIVQCIQFADDPTTS